MHIVPELTEKVLAVLLKDQALLTKLYLARTNLGNSHTILFKHLKQLEVLDLTDNEFGYIQESTLPKLVENGDLYLFGNKIMYIEEDAFKGLRNRSVTLNENPWHCSCKLAPFSSWLRSNEGAAVVDRQELICDGPIQIYGQKVVDYDPYWWECSPYVPLVALLFIVGFLLTVAIIALIVYCNWINIKHCCLERREMAKPIDDEHRDREDEPVGRDSLGQRAGGYSSLRQGKTGAYIIYDMYDRAVLNWVNKYVEDQLFRHPMKITLQFSAGPEVIPLWKQVKDFSFQVNFFLVLVTDGFLELHWPEIAQKSGIDNIMKCVFVLHGKKKSELPKEMTRLSCPCFQWPETGTRFTTPERERDQFWKKLRLALKRISV
ncbi:trophoblast glycoprotein-like [Lineus longissimus]|uniref:trophoblast glycoprotein-like n=1 Tax=Lineus longissimus TaxID=88925 RepID=UPI00315D6899